MTWLTFLNIGLLAGAAAAAIPLIIHIINRSRFQVERWGAMHLLEQVLRTRRRRLKLEQLLLLLVRTLIPLILALCLARPVFTGMSELLGKAKTSTVVLLDNSYSMNAAGTAGSNLARAREEVKALFDELPRGSEASIVWMAGGDLAPVGPTFDPARLRGALTLEDQGFGMADPAAALEKAAGLLSKAHYADRDLVLVSDFQRINWSPNSAAERQRSMDLLQGLPVPPRVTLFRVGKQVKDNIAVESLSLSRPVLGVGQKIRVRATLRNFGKVAFPDLRVYFRIDGQERSASQLSLGASETGQALFSHTFDKPGSHVIEVYADADTLRADNVMRVSVPVWDRLPVLLVSGDRNPEGMRSETAFLEIALQPFAASGDAAPGANLADLIRTQTIAPEELRAEQLADARVVVLANVRQLNDGQVAALETFVREGGGLLVFPGDRVNREWYNSKLVAGGRGVMPFAFGELSGSLEESERPATVVVQHYDHPALELFNDPRNGSLGGSRIRLWYGLQAPEAAGEQLSVLARLDGGDPFLVEKTFGAGRAIVCCTPCDADWNNLPLRLSYLPLMQQLVTYLASKVYPPRNVEVGQRLAAILPRETVGKTAALTGPEGKRYELKVQDRQTHGLVEYDRTGRPGLYVLEAPGVDPVHFVVSTSRIESNLALLKNDEFTEVAKVMDAQAVTSGEEYRALEQRRRFGREFWKPLLWAILALMFIEMFLQQRFSRVKT